MADLFEAIPREDRVFETRHFFAVFDGFPVSEGHLLLIAQERVLDFRDLSPEAKADLPSAIDRAISYLDGTIAPDGYNIGMNCGEAAGQTVFRFHCHIIPRSLGDVPDPSGGVRHAVIGRGYY